MGLVQTTNLIQNFREDVDQQPYLWALEIFGKEEYGFTEIMDVDEPAALQIATWMQSGVVLDVLRHACNSLDYRRF